MDMEHARTIVSTSAAIAASAVFLRTFVYDFLPDELRGYIWSAISRAYTRWSSQFTIVIDESEGLKPNPVYNAADNYLGAKVSPSTRNLRVSQEDGEKSLVVTIERGEEIVDEYEGIAFKWQLVCHPPHRVYNSAASAAVSMARSFRLTFHCKHKDEALGSYLPYVMDRSKAIKEESKAIKIHLGRYEELFSGGNVANVWTPMVFDHPATFDTLAMDPELKREVIDDLRRFANGKKYYRSRGRVWKRGYLLYGPPGTGKTSMIAAMANFLKYYVYSVELTEMFSNSDLERLLVSTSSRSILVIEDIDCNIELENRETENNPKRAKKVTLSGLLNFMDGLWSCCGDGRIIVFTTNHKDRLDPALLRPGRMDMHVHMSYCSPLAFKTLASNYLGVNDHVLFGAIEGLIERQVEVTPAEIAGELMKSDDPETALHGLVKFLQKKIGFTGKAEEMRIY